MKSKILLIILISLITPIIVFANPFENSVMCPKKTDKKRSCQRTINIKNINKRAEITLQKYGCLVCHSIFPPPKTAPPFLAIKRRYIRYFHGDIRTAKEYIKNRIINGSKGNWYRFRNSQMPAYPNISQKDLEEIANAIFNIGF